MQNGLYERYLRAYLPLTEWMAIVDLDEFMYGRQESIAEYLLRVPKDVGRLEVGRWESNMHQSLVALPS